MRHQPKIRFGSFRRSVRRPLASETPSKVSEDGVDIENARGQSYNNAENMARKYNGEQAHILQKNVSARFVPRAAQS
jgi:hypothetical protein